MSMENAQKFYNKARKDPAIWAQIQQAVVSGKPEMEVASAIVSIGRSKGFDFTAAEAQSFRDMKFKEQAKKIPQIFAKAWMDKQFHQRLLSNPMKVFEEEGVDVPPGVEMRVVADSEKVRHIILPTRPPSEEVSLEQLAAVAGGAATCTPPGQIPGQPCTPIPSCATCVPSTCVSSCSASSSY